MTDNWSFMRFIKESRAFTRPMPWYRFYPQAVKRWFWFDHQQKMDAADREKEMIFITEERLRKDYIRKDSLVSLLNSEASTQAELNISYGMNKSGTPWDVLSIALRRLANQVQGL